MIKKVWLMRFFYYICQKFTYEENLPYIVDIYIVECRCAE